MSYMVKHSGWRNGLAKALCQTCDLSSVLGPTRWEESRLAQLSSSHALGHSESAKQLKIIYKPRNILKVKSFFLPIVHSR